MSSGEAHVEPARSRFCASAGGLSLAARPERWSVAIAGFRRHVCILNCGQSHLLTTFPLCDVSADEVDTNQRCDSCDDDGDALGRTVRAPVVSSNHNALNFLAVLTLVDDVVDDLVGNFGVPVGYVTDDLDHRRHEQLHLSDALTDRDCGQEIVFWFVAEVVVVVDTPEVEDPSSAMQSARCSEHVTGPWTDSCRHRRQNLQAAHPHCVENKLGVWEIAQWRSRFMPLTDVAEGLFAADSLWLPAIPVELPDSMAVDLERQRQRNWEQYIKQRARIGNYLPEASRRRRGVARIVDMLVAFTIAGLMPSWEEV